MTTIYLHKSLKLPRKLLIEVLEDCHELANDMWRAYELKKLQDNKLEEHLTDELSLESGNEIKRIVSKYSKDLSKRQRTTLSGFTKGYFAAYVHARGEFLDEYTTQKKS